MRRSFWKGRKFYSAKKAGETPEKLEAFQSFKRSGIYEIIMNPGGTRVQISASNEETIMLVAPDGFPLAVFKRSKFSALFDRRKEH